MNFILIVNLILFGFIYIMSFHLVINRDDWFLVWLGLEINIITFIIFIFRGNRIANVESCLKYFFIQRLGSAIFISVFYLNKRLLDFSMCFLLRYKIGAGPFFFWFPSVCSGISWMSCFFLITFQKLIPLIILSIFISWIFYLIILFSLIFGVFGSFNQRDLKQLIAFSSVYHLGWILLCELVDDISWIIYLFVYRFIVFPVVNLLKWLEIDRLIKVIKMKYKNWFALFILRIAGIPPFLGFFLKWFAFIVIFNYDYFFILLLILCSVVIFYVYFRVVYDVLIIYYDSGLWGNCILFNISTYYLDLVSLLGLIIGLFFGVFFLL